MFIVIDLLLIGYFVILANQVERMRPVLPLHVPEKGPFSWLYPEPVDPDKPKSKSEEAPYEAKRKRQLLLVFSMGAIAWVMLIALPFGESMPPRNALEEHASTIALVFAGLSGLVLLLHPVRRKVQVVFPGFDAESYVHRTALVLILLDLALEFNAYVRVTWESLLPASRDFAGVPFSATLTLVIFSVMALVGVGLGTRRAPGALCERLKLRRPRVGDVLWGAAGACLTMYIVLAATGTLLPALGITMDAIPDAAESQMHTLLADGLTPLVIGVTLLAALGAGVGEELLYRGALQPIFGLVPTTLYFAFSHGEYLMKVGWLSVLVGGFVFGLLRNKQSTVAAIIAHTGYNFLVYMMIVP